MYDKRKEYENEQLIYARKLLRVEIATMKKLKQRAKDEGVSVNAYICDLIEKSLK